MGFVPALLLMLAVTLLKDGFDEYILSTIKNCTPFSTPPSKKKRIKHPFPPWEGLTPLRTAVLNTKAQLEKFKEKQEEKENREMV